MLYNCQNKFAGKKRLLRCIEKSPLERTVYSGGPMKGPQHKIRKKNVNGSCEENSTQLLSGASKLSPQGNKNRFQTKFSLYFALRNGSLVCQIIPQLVHKAFAVTAISRHSGVSHPAIIRYNSME
jgi:hypothetical protein